MGQQCCLHSKKTETKEKHDLVEI
uniref:Uncharacterized protein n=1 Tax=Arundo donax TaxID=35708 RepID=A0A0A9FS85_ARUDO